MDERRRQRRGFKRWKKSPRHVQAQVNSIQSPPQLRRCWLQLAATGSDGAPPVSTSRAIASAILPLFGFIRSLSITSISLFIRPHFGKVHACNHFIGCIEFIVVGAMAGKLIHFMRAFSLAACSERVHWEWNGRINVSKLLCVLV